jgi:ABC-2 type transport system ATP-binding protein
MAGAAVIGARPLESVRCAGILFAPARLAAPNLHETLPMPSETLAIHARAVRRVYKAKPEPVTALAGVDLDVEPGEYFGLLGPNGAGKTTLIKILTTLLLPTSGTARVAGFDVVRETAKIRRVINMVAGGEQSGYGLLTVREQLWMFSQFYGLPNREGWRRVDELIEIVGLQERRQQKVRALSTGERQKLNFARGLLNDPWVLFLDEPTLGLDVSAARDLREHTLRWKKTAPGRTVLLTTHYMVEADQLCDRIAIVDHGRILALGTPAELRRRVQSESIFRIELDQLPRNGGLAMLNQLPGVLSAVRADDSAEGDPAGASSIALKVALASDSALTSVVTSVAEHGSNLIGLQKSEPSLEDVFVELVGRGFGEEQDGELA